VTAGILTTVIISFVTDYYTSMKHKPVQEIAKASETGSATNVITGLAVGMQSTFIPVIIISIATVAAYYFAGLYGIGLAALGLLSITGMIMSLDSYGPISDNAGGIAEMSKLPPKVRKVTDALDAVGNTTKATTKGVAIASAAISALALFAAFAEASGITSIDLLNVKVLTGLLIGGAIPFLFSAFTMRAVSRAAFSIVIEVRRQFKTIKGIMSGKAKPDYAKSVDIATQAALKELTAPALLAVLAPVVTGLLLGPEGLAGLLAGSIVSGLMLAITLSNAGGAWDNAKKYIEVGHFGGKGSDAHKAAVIGDTVGDPAKDTSGPSINSLIKVMNTLAILLAPFLVAYALHI
jgi:K(+)-stimulated pyrophosphate-energized sodium pump